MIIVCPHCKHPFERTKRKLTGTKLERFNQRVFVAPNGCWLWLGGLGKRGYPHFSWNQKTLYAHRISWELFRGPIEEGKDVCHNCPGGDNPMCVNPDHLFIGTHTENMADMLRKGRRRCWGEKARTAKLKNEQVIVIRALAAKGWKQQNIADLYGVRQTTISQIVTESSWRHLIPNPQ